jgi:hypothetical protein
LAVFDEETLAAVCAAPLFSISPSVIAVLKLTIVTTAAEFSQEELGALMDRLQIPSPISATFTASDVVKRWNQAPFTILIEFLEHDASLPEPWAKNRTTDTFQFLAQRCTRQNVSRSLQHRFATWFRTIIDDPSLYSHSDMVWAIIDWLYNSTSCEPFDDMEARRTIGEALEMYAAGLSSTAEAMRGRVKVLVITLNSAPGINMDGPGVSVPAITQQ